MYIFGRNFEIETDQKPLEYIYSRKSKPSAPLERWTLRLYAFDFIYTPRRTNIADALPRLNCRVHFRGVQKAFLVENEIEHRTTPPLGPQANGKVERQNHTLLKVIPIAQIEGKDGDKSFINF